MVTRRHIVVVPCHPCVGRRDGRSLMDGRSPVHVRVVHHVRIAVVTRVGVASSGMMMLPTGPRHSIVRCNATLRPRWRQNGWGIEYCVVGNGMVVALRFIL